MEKIVEMVVKASSDADPSLTYEIVSVSDTMLRRVQSLADLCKQRRMRMTTTGEGLWPPGMEPPLPAEAEFEMDVFQDGSFCLSCAHPEGVISTSRLRLGEVAAALAASPEDRVVVLHEEVRNDYERDCMAEDEAAAAAQGLGAMYASSFER